MCACQSSVGTKVADCLSRAILSDILPHINIFLSWITAMSCFWLLRYRASLLSFHYKTPWQLPCWPHKDQRRTCKQVCIHPLTFNYCGQNFCTIRRKPQTAKINSIQTLLVIWYLFLSFFLLLHLHYYLLTRYLHAYSFINFWCRLVFQQQAGHDVCMHTIYHNN